MFAVGLGAETVRRTILVGSQRSLPGTVRSKLFVGERSGVLRPGFSKKGSGIVARAASAIALRWYVFVAMLGCLCEAHCFVPKAKEGLRVDE